MVPIEIGERVALRQSLAILLGIRSADFNANEPLSDLTTSFQQAAAFAVGELLARTGMLGSAEILLLLQTTWQDFPKHCTLSQPWYFCMTANRPVPYVRKHAWFNWNTSRVLVLPEGRLESTISETDTVQITVPLLQTFQRIAAGDKDVTRAGTC